MARHSKKKREENKENKRPKKSYSGLNRPKRLRQWTNDSMLRAMDAVKNGLMGQNRAALEYGVPCTAFLVRLLRIACLERLYTERIWAQNLT